MNINIYVESVIVDGVSISHHQRPLLQAGLESELSRLFTKSGTPDELCNAGNQACISAPVLQLNSSPDPKVFGAQAGARIYSALSGQKQRGQGDG